LDIIYRRKKMENSKFDWSNFAVAVGAFALTTGIGYLAVSAVNKKGKLTKKQLLPIFGPSTGAGVIAYFLRKKCPPCMQQVAPGSVAGVPFEPDVLI